MTARNGAGTVVVPLQELLEAMSDGVLITDENGRCTYSNPALDDMVGAKACDPTLNDDAPGWISLPHQNEYRRFITRSLNGRIPRRPQSVSWSLMNLSGESIATTAKIIPMHNGTGPSAALLWIFSPAPGEVRIDPGSQAPGTRRCHASHFGRAGPDRPRCRQRFSRDGADTS